MLFTGDHGEESDGPRPLGATQYFNRLAQRVVGALTVATASGALYEVDTRLRPSGAQGLLCVSFESFAKYQREEAWTWEHMALTRARPVCGSATARGQLESIIAESLTMPRDAAKLAEDIVKMRTDMAIHKPPKGALDVKLLPGGLVDAEFVIHALQLRFGQGFAPAQALLTRLLVMLRLVAPIVRSRPNLHRRWLPRRWASPIGSKSSRPLMLRAGSFLPNGRASRRE